MMYYVAIFPFIQQTQQYRFDIIILLYIIKTQGYKKLSVPSDNLAQLWPHIATLSLFELY